MCCGNLVEVNRGIKLLGIWSFLQTSLVFMEGFNLIMTDRWWGIHLMMFNFVYILQSWWYYKWFTEDSFETRRDLLLGYKYVLCQTVALYLMLFAVLIYIPSAYFPDSYEDNFG